MRQDFDNVPFNSYVEFMLKIYFVVDILVFLDYRCLTFINFFGAFVATTSS